jgi:hypothetical protein
MEVPHDSSLIGFLSQILLEQPSILIDDEGHDAGIAVLCRIGYVTWPNRANLLTHVTASQQSLRCRTHSAAKICIMLVLTVRDTSGLPMSPE